MLHYEQAVVSYERPVCPDSWLQMFWSDLSGSNFEDICQVGHVK